MLKRVINCKIHKQRLKKFKKYVKKAKLDNIKRVDCVNGKEFTDDVLKKMIKKNILSNNADVNPIEIAICLSHRKCWKDLIESKQKYMIVFEDDSRIYKSFLTKLNSIIEANLDFDILYLWNGNWNRTLSKRKKIANIDGIEISQETTNYIPGTPCYVITREWAKILYKKLFPINKAIDAFMGSVRVKSSKHYTVNNKRRKNDDIDCWPLSPFLFTACPDEGNTTQDYSVKTIEERDLMKENNFNFNKILN